MLIIYHSAALGVFPGGVPWEEASTPLAQTIAEVTSYPFPPLDTGCTDSGTLADYAVSAGIAAVDLELTNHYDADLQVLDVLNFAPWRACAEWNEVKTSYLSGHFFSRICRAQSPAYSYHQRRTNDAAG